MNNSDSRADRLVEIFVIINKRFGSLIEYSSLEFCVPHSIRLRNLTNTQKISFNFIHRFFLFFPD